VRRIDQPETAGTHLALVILMKRLVALVAGTALRVIAAEIGRLVMEMVVVVVA
jgi:hypothetical protein